LYCNNIKTCCVLTKSKEQEDLLITLISKIENAELKEEYLKKLMKVMIKDINKPASAKISLDETLERFSKQKSKIITISDLQHEIINIKREIVSLKSDLQTVKIDNNDLKQQLLLLNLQNCFRDNNSENEENDKKFEQSDEVESSNKEISILLRLSDLLIKLFLPMVLQSKYYCFSRLFY
jgi:hypothetical protein